MKKYEYSVVAGRGNGKLLEFIYDMFPYFFGLTCIAISILTVVAILFV